MIYPRRVGERADHLYLDLLKRALSRSLFDPIVDPVTPKGHSLAGAVFGPLRRLLATRRLVLARSKRASDVFAESPPLILNSAETLIGPVGLDNLQQCIEDVLRREVPGDFIEAGVWRGGSVIFMRGALAAYGDDRRTVWAADSFRGLSSPDVSRYAQDASEKDWASEKWLAVSLDEVKQAVARYASWTTACASWSDGFTRRCRVRRSSSSRSCGSTAICMARRWTPCGSSTRSCPPLGT